MKNAVDLTTILDQYRGLWVVLDTTMKRVISSGKTAKTAHDEAVKKGQTTPMLFKVPQENMPYIGVLFTS
jgi:hypothetical protein